MSQISLIALDLDGTLLNSEKKISSRNRAALAAAQAQGVKVVLTTGRPFSFGRIGNSRPQRRVYDYLQRWSSAAK